MGAPMPGTMPPPMAPPGAYAPAPQRPLGVTILAILAGLAGVVEILGGVAIMALSGAAAFAGYGILAGLGAALGVLILLLGIITLVYAIGLWKLRGWAWWLAIIVGVISIVVGAITANWISVGINLIIVIYLFVVRRHFGIAGRPAGM